MPDLSREELHRLARLGAQARLEEIRREEAAIRKTFPELFNKSTRPVTRATAADSSGASDEVAPKGRRRRRRNNMSPAMRKAVSERMRKYWAERRKAKNAK